MGAREDFFLMRGILVACLLMEMIQKREQS